MSTDAQITRIQVLEQLLQTTREGFWFIDNDTLTLDVNSAMCWRPRRVRMTLPR